MTKTPETFEVGGGATACYYTDRKAMTVIEAAPKKVKVQRDKATLLNGFTSGEPDALKFYPGGFAGHTEGVQRYAYEPDPEGQVMIFTLRNNGKWVAQGAGKNNGTTLIAGRYEFYDFNF